MPDSKTVYRWFLVGICMVAISAGPAAFTLSSFGPAVGGIQADFGWSRGSASMALSAMMMTVAATLPFVGMLIDRFGTRPVLLPSVAGFGLMLIAVPAVTALWQFIALFVAMGFFGAAAGSVGYLRMLAGWFDRSRGLAIGIAGSGTGLGFAYVPLLSQWAVGEAGWRAVYWLLGGIVLLVIFPAVVFFLRPNPELAEMPDAHSQIVSESEGLTLGEAAWTADFWLMTGIFAAVAAVFYGFIPHLVPMLEDRGIDSATAALTASIFGLATFVGRILIGWLVDRFEARRVAALFFGLSAIGMGLLAVPLPLGAVMISALLLGGSLGAEVDMLAYLVTRYFGLRCFARIFGTMFSVVMMSMAIGPVLFGWVFDRTGSYAFVVAAGVPACLVAMLCASLLSPRSVSRVREMRAVVVSSAE